MVIVMEYVSLIALVLSVISLSWQVFTWSRAGARLTVAYGWSYPVGWREPVAHRSIIVTNRGRASTMVSSVTSVLPDKHHLPLIADAFERYELPYELRPGESITLHYPPKAIEQALVLQGIPLTTKIRPMASSGHGDVKGKWLPVNQD